MVEPATTSNRCLTQSINSNFLSCFPLQFALAGRLLCVLLFVILGVTSASAQDSQLSPLLYPGNAAMTGFSGVSSTYGEADLPENSTVADETFIDLNGSALRVFDLERSTREAAPIPLQLQTFEIGPREIGQVFGIALDDRTLPGSDIAAPNIYLTATSAYGLHIVSPDSDGDGLPERLKQGGADAKWMDGLFGLDKSGGPGSVWKVDGVTGEVSLFADLKLNGAANSGPGLGNIVFDAANRQFFVSDRDTGLIHRLDMSGQELGVFDHGVDGRAAHDLEAVRHDPDDRADITSPDFRSDDPATWGSAALQRRIWGLAVHRGRLYYAVAEGPQIWSVEVANGGGFGEVRWELDLPADIEPYEISDIAFTARGRMVLAQRGQPTGAYDFLKPIKSDAARVLRFRLETPANPATKSRWIADADEFAVGQTGDFRNSEGGLALGYGYTRQGGFNYRACKATLWTSGRSLRQVTKRTLLPRPAAARDETLYLDGLQGAASSLVRPENAPPRRARFIDFDGAYSAERPQGWLGDIAIPVVCQLQGQEAPPFVPPVVPEPLPPAQSILDLAIDKRQIGDCSIGGICSFELAITNRGSQTYRGPLIISDQVSQSGLSLVGYGAAPWSCLQSGVEISCRRPDLVLQPGRSTSLYMDFRLLAKILIPGYNNCGTISWLGNANDAGTIKDIQIALADMGFYVGPIDGLMTPATSQAISDYEIAWGLPATGAVTPWLLDKLYGPGLRPAGDASPANDRDCADVIFVEGPIAGPGPIGPWPAGLEVSIGGQAECPFGQDCSLGLTIRNTLPVPFDQEVDGLVELKRLGAAVPEQIAQTPGFCAGPIAQMDLECRFRLQLGPNQARSYPLRLTIQDALLDPANVANHGPDGQVRAEACFAVEDLGWFGWLFGQEFDRDCHIFIVPEGVVAAPGEGGPGDEGAPGEPGDDAPADDPQIGEAPELADDLVITKTARKQNCKPEQPCLFDITLKNNGSVTTGDRIRFVETFPHGIRSEAITSSDGALSCSRGGPSRFICSGARELNVAADREFKFEATFAALADNRAAGLENCVTLDKDGDGVADADETKSCAQVKLLPNEGDEPRGPLPAADISITNRAVNTTCKPGTDCWFDVKVSNNGHTDFSGEVELRNVPSIGGTSLDWPIDFGPQGRWQCEPASNRVDYRVCKVTGLSSGQTLSLPVKVRIPEVGALPIPIFNQRILTECASVYFDGQRKEACAGANLDITNTLDTLVVEKLAEATCEQGGHCDFYIRLYAKGERGYVQNFTLIDQARKIGGTQLRMPITAGGPGCTTPPTHVPFTCRRRLSLPPFQGGIGRAVLGLGDNSNSVVTQFGYRVKLPDELKAGDSIENCFQLLFAFEGKTYRPVTCTTVKIAAAEEELDTNTQDLTPQDDAPDGPLKPLAGRFGPQLSVNKVAGSRSCQANGDCRFAITVANNGIAPYQGPLEISERMEPKTARLLRTTPSPWACNGSNGNYICRHPNLTLDVGQSKTVNLTFRMPNAARGDVRNCANFSWKNNMLNGRAVAAKQALKVMGFDPGAAHPRLTSKAQNAIRAFQRRQGMRVSGAIDAALMSALVQGWGVGDQNAVDDNICVSASFIKAPRPLDPGSVVTPITCPRGQFFDPKLKRCRARCASGTVFDGKQCVSRCPEAERWNGQQCVNRCSAGQRWNGKQCVNRCRSSQRWDGKQCVNRCSTSQRWDSRRDRCVNRCSSSQRWDGKQCINRCPSGQRWNGKQCVSQCSRGKVFDAKRNRCVCPSGKTEVRGQCLTLQPTPSGQTTSPGQSTVQPAPRCRGDKIYDAKRKSCVCPREQLDVRGKCTIVRIQPGQTINPNLILPR